MKKQLSLISISILAIAIILFTTSAKAQVSCGSSSGWTNFSNNPQVNQAHIFCGQLDNNRPKGFHSRPNGINPATVKAVRITQSANAQGIYGIQWTYVNTNASKSSTMYPDRCTQTQVLNSIRYAGTHQNQCPANAPNWSWCGKNRPDPLSSSDQNLYCNTNNGQLFTIAGASLNNGNINTAFPLR